VVSLESLERQVRGVVMAPLESEVWKVSQDFSVILGSRDLLERLERRDHRDSRGSAVLRVPMDGKELLERRERLGVQEMQDVMADQVLTASTCRNLFQA